MSILSTIRTRDLLPLTTVCRRLYSAILLVLQTRLSHIAELPGHRLILECYHPSVAISTPWMYCDYLSTDDPNGGGNDDGLSIAKLGSLYSHFRPIDQEDNYPLRSWPRRRRSQQQQQQQQPSEEQSDDELQQPSHDVHLEENELFTQLCTMTNVVKVGPGRFHFLSHANVSDGVIRVWRDWLAAKAAVEAGVEGGGTHVHDDRPAVLWADAGQHVGLRFSVSEVAATTAPVLVSSEEEMPVSYRLGLEELLVRTHRLLLAMEEAEVQKPAAADALMVISW